jgi:hypothetical protein
MIRAAAILMAFASLEILFPQPARAEPTAAEIEQILHNLFSPDHDQIVDDNLRRAFMRGYQRGREDEARAKSNQPARPPAQK